MNEAQDVSRISDLFTALVDEIATGLLHLRVHGGDHHEVDENGAQNRSFGFLGLGKGVGERLLGHGLSFEGGLRARRHGTTADDGRSPRTGGRVMLN